MKKQNTSDLVVVAAAAGAAAAGAILAIYEVLKTEKAQAGISRAKTGVVNTAGRVKKTVVDTAAKIKKGKKVVAVADDDCDLDLVEEVAEEEAVEEDAEA